MSAASQNHTLSALHDRIVHGLIAHLIGIEKSDMTPGERRLAGLLIEGDYCEFVGEFEQFSLKVVPYEVLRAFDILLNSQREAITA